jgi:soluble P-type ATPase
LFEYAAAIFDIGGCMRQPTKGIVIHIPGSSDLRIHNILLDYTGTLSQDGVLLDGVVDRLRALSEFVRIIVATADTFGKAQDQLRGLPVEIILIQNGQDKRRLLEELGKSETASIGNGNNDVEMIRAAALGIAVIGPEGCAGELIASARIVCQNILDCLDLFLHPMRLTATLRR